jgi:hypothetical protein
MTTDEKNEFLAEYMGWEKSFLRFDGKKIPRFRVPNVFGEDRGTTDFATSAMQFHLDWGWFQQALQRAIRERGELDSHKVGYNIIEAFMTNNVMYACDILIEFLKEKEK